MCWFLDYVAQTELKSCDIDLTPFESCYIVLVCFLYRSLVWLEDL